MMQLKPFSNPFAKKMIDRKTPELVFIDEDLESDFTEDQEDTLVEAKPMNIPTSAALSPNIGPLDKRKTASLLGSENGDSDSRASTEVTKSDSASHMDLDKPENKTSPAEVQPAPETVKRVKIDLPAKDIATDGKLSSKDRMPPRIRRASTTIFSHSTIEAPQAQMPPRPNRLYSLPNFRDESLSPPPLLRRASTLRNGPPPPPKPIIRSLQRRPTTPAEAQPTRQASRVNSITLPALDITQNSNGRMYRESELLLDLFNTFRDQWPDRPYAVMNHLRTSLLLSVSVFDDDYAKPPFASEHGGAGSIKQVVSRFRRVRRNKDIIDLCLVVWDPTFMSFREQSVLQETHRYKPRYSGRSNEWVGAQKVIWYPSWEPTRNLPEGMAEGFSSERDKVWKAGKEQTFEAIVADGDWC